MGDLLYVVIGAVLSSHLGEMKHLVYNGANLAKRVTKPIQVSFQR